MAPNIYYSNHVGEKVLWLNVVCLPQLHHIRYFGQIVTNILDGKNIKLESIYGECKESSDTV